MVKGGLFWPIMRMSWLLEQDLLESQLRLQQILGDSAQKF
jgi:hypothetical protein